jgi:hypothetical protein
VTAHFGMVYLEHMRTPDPSDEWFDLYAATAGRAAVFELRVRLAIDAIPELKGSLSGKLSALVDDLVAWMAAEGVGTVEERQLLRNCAVIRNRLFHVELSRMTGKAVSLGVELERSGVRMFRTEGELTTEKFLAELDGGGAPVRKTRTTEGLLYGWLIEAHFSGAFGAASRALDDGVEVIKRTLRTNAERLTSKPPDAGG